MVLRIILIILTSPVWLIAAAVLIPVVIVGYFVRFIMSCIEYGFTGRWDFE